MAKLIKTIFRMTLRLVLLLAGLIVMASLLGVALLVLALWLIRASWARLTGKPVQPWTFQVNRQVMWSRFHRPPGHHPASRRDESNVIDVEIKEVREITSPGD